MTLPIRKRRETFILRMWRDTGENSQWRGQVQCVSTGKTTAFHDISALFNYVKTQLDEENNPPKQQGLR